MEESTKWILVFSLVRLQLFIGASLSGTWTMTDKHGTVLEHIISINMTHHKKFHSVDLVFMFLRIGAIWLKEEEYEE